MPIGHSKSNSSTQTTVLEVQKLLINKQHSYIWKCCKGEGGGTDDKIEPRVFRGKKKERKNAMCRYSYGKEDNTE